MKEPSNLPLTLAQSLINEGVITDPNFIKAADRQAELIKEGSYRLLGSILADLGRNSNSEPAKE